jgi:hypothetical protein
MSEQEASDTSNNITAPRGGLAAQHVTIACDAGHKDA